MLDDSTVNQSTMITTNLPFRDKYPSIMVNVKTISVLPIKCFEDSDRKWPWLCDTHKEVIINDGDLQFVIHQCIAGVLKTGHKYKVWYGTSDAHNRYKEILMVEEVQQGA